MKTAIEVGNDMLKAKPVRTMTRAEAEILLALTMITKSGRSFADALAGGLAKGIPMPPTYEILSKRLDYHKVPYDAAAAFWLSSCSDRPGTAVLYAAALAALAHRNGNKAASFDDVVDAFAMGVPDEPALQKVWESQKRPGHVPDNWLDDPEAWTARQFPD